MTIPTSEPVQPSGADTGLTGALLARDRIDRFRPTGAFGKPAYQSHVQLRAMLKARCGDAVANYFARPTYDPDKAELSWHAEVPGPARRWEDMDERDREDASLQFEVIRSRLTRFVEELRQLGSSKPGSAAAFGSVLEQALLTPAQDGVFLQYVGTQPIISFWGFENHDGRHVNPALAPHYVRRGGAPAPGAVGPGSEPDAGTTPAVSLPGPAGASAVRRPAWWRWLLLALLALALAAAALWLLRGCTAPVGDARVAMPDSSTQPPAVGASGARDGGVRPEGGGTTILPGGAAAPGDRPDANPPQGPDSDPTKGPPPDGPNAQRPPDGPKPPGKTDAPGNPPKTAPPAPPDTLKMPENAQAADPSMDYLRGNWKAGGLADQRSRLPLDLKFKFDKDGKGEITLTRPDGTRCSGPVQGSMAGGKLDIAGASVPCTGGGSYAPPAISCSRDAAGRTRCSGSNKDGSRYDMDMERGAP